MCFEYYKPVIESPSSSSCRNSSGMSISILPSFTSACSSTENICLTVRESNYLNRDDWIRTSGPFVPNEVRYQTAPHPVMCSYVIYRSNKAITREKS